jgi:AraC family transcriptional regulator
MYFTSLPDHSTPGFDNQLHFSRFKQHNIVFNTVSSYSYCHNHVGCLSLKTVLSGEEWYTINNRRVAIRPGQFLILNNDQNYSCSIDALDKVRGISVFFKKEFASAVLRDAMNTEQAMLDTPFTSDEKPIEFFQTLHAIQADLQLQLVNLIADLETGGYTGMTDEYLVLLLQHLIKTHKSELKRADKVAAIKPGSKKEIYKRLCVAKDLLHSTFMDAPDLNSISSIACLSVPQLIRQFKAVFQITPYQYLIQLRLKNAVELLKFTNKPIHEITWNCGFENVSAFCRAFKLAYGVKPLSYRKANS